MADNQGEFLQGARALHLQVYQVRKGRQETGMAELRPAGHTEEQEENAVETGMGTEGGV